MLDPNLVAVAPFDVLDPKLALWREGLVDVLARTIDGLGPLRTVSPTVALRRWAGRADSPSARDLGRRTGARLAIFGQLVAIGGDSVRLSATVVDVPTGTQRSEFERSDGVSSRGPVRLGSVGTTSIVALKAFLQGEQHFRRGALDSAIAYFERATSLDTTFALAFWRLGLAHGWRDVSSVSSSPLYLRAGRLNHGLSPRDSLLITADSLAAGDDDLLDSARRSPMEKRRFQALETASLHYPGDPEVWYQLGEAREHNGPEVGATVAQELDAFDRSIALDSTFGEAYVHPIQRTLQRGDCRQALTYLRPAASMNLALENMPAALAAGPVLTQLLYPAVGGAAEIQPILDTLSDEMVNNVAFMLRHCADSAETDIRLARQLERPRPGRAKMAYPRDANNTLALTLANHGHLRESYEVLQRQPIAADGSGLILIQLALLGAVPKDTAEMLFHRWLRGPDAELAMFPLPWWASQGDTSAVQAAITRAGATLLASPDNPVASEAAEIGPMYLALARHDTMEVLRWRPGLPEWPDVLLLRARLLVAQRRDSTAAAWLDWYDSWGPLNVLGRLEQARVNERLGERGQAVVSYRFVVDMWRHPDPELLPYVREAQAALVRLTGENIP